jgi:hypothetical protein
MVAIMLFTMFLSAMLAALKFSERKSLKMSGRAQRASNRRQAGRWHVADGSFATDRWAPKIAPCPLFPESDATSDPWLRSRRVTGVVAVSPCNVPL